MSTAPPATASAEPKTYALAAPIKKTCDLFRLLAGHEVLGLAPAEIAKGLGVPPSWVSVNLPALETTGFVERVQGTPRWRLGVQFVRIALTVSTNLNQAKRQLDDLTQRYSVPIGHTTMPAAPVSEVFNSLFNNNRK